MPDLTVQKRAKKWVRQFGGASEHTRRNLERGFVAGWRSHKATVDRAAAQLRRLPEIIAEQLERGE